MSHDADLLFADRVEVEFGILVGLLAGLVLIASLGGIRPVFTVAGSAFTVGLYFVLRFLKTLARIADSLERLADDGGSD